MYDRQSLEGPRRLMEIHLDMQLQKCQKMIGIVECVSERWAT